MTLASASRSEVSDACSSECEAKVESVVVYSSSTALDSAVPTRKRPVLRRVVNSSAADHGPLELWTDVVGQLTFWPFEREVHFVQPIFKTALV